VFVKNFGKSLQTLILKRAEVLEINTEVNWNTLNVLIRLDVFIKLLWSVDIGFPVFDLHQIKHAITVILGVPTDEED
jgi:hypothetical protein